MSDRKGERVLEGLSVLRFKSICILGGKSLGNKKVYLDVAKELRQILAARGINVAYEGGLQGLRGCVATIVLIKGRNVLSVKIKDQNSGSLAVGTEMQVRNLPERLGYLFQNGEAFIILLGSLGTMSEIFSLAYWFSLDLHKKTIGIININGFFDGLLTFLDNTVAQEFMTPAAHNTISSASSVEKIIDQLQASASNLNSSMGPPDQQASKRRLLPDINL